MTNLLDSDNPIVIGGLGGSGTRVVADILIKLNYFLGSDLNPSTDNLAFSYLFKRPYIYSEKKINKKIFKKSIHILTNSMIDNKVFTIKNTAFLFRLFMFNIIKKQKQFNSNREALQRFKRIIKPSSTYNSNYNGWGWKEPNSHVFLSQLADYYPNMKYIHVIRHGLDMVFSSNSEQFWNWHSFYNIKIPKQDNLIPVAQLDYWIKANQKAISIAKQKIGSNFLLINFDDLCESPERQITKILDFIGVEKKSHTFKQLVSMPKTPKTKDRYKQHDISIFSEVQKEKVKEMGFKII